VRRKRKRKKKRKKKKVRHARGWEGEERKREMLVVGTGPCNTMIELLDKYDRFCFWLVDRRTVGEFSLKEGE
jgi:transposase